MAALSTLLLIPYMDYFFFNRACYSSDSFKSNVVNIANVLLAFALALSVISYLSYCVLIDQKNYFEKWDTMKTCLDDFTQIDQGQIDYINEQATLIWQAMVPSVVALLVSVPLNIAQRCAK